MEDHLKKFIDLSDRAGKGDEARAMIAELQNLSRSDVLYVLASINMMTVGIASQTAEEMLESMTRVELATEGVAKEAREIVLHADDGIENVVELKRFIDNQLRPASQEAAREMKRIVGAVKLEKKRSSIIYSSSLFFGGAVVGLIFACLLFLFFGGHWLDARLDKIKETMPAANVASSEIMKMSEDGWRVKYSPDPRNSGAGNKVWVWKDGETKGYSRTQTVHGGNLIYLIGD